MKKAVLIISLLIFHTLYAENNEWEGLILKKMLHSISNHKNMTIYSEDKRLINELKYSRYIHIVNNCNESDFILAREKIDDKCKKPTIVFRYYDYLHTPVAVGVFFWQKGRPTIRFSAKRLKYFDLHVKGELSKFVSTND